MSQFYKDTQSIANELPMNMNNIERNVERNVERNIVRNWNMEKSSNDVPITTIFQNIMDPTSIWSIVTASALTFVVVTIILLFFKPTIVLDQKSSKVSPKKLIFVAFVSSGVVAGVSLYLQRRY